MALLHRKPCRAKPRIMPGFLFECRYADMLDTRDGPLRIDGGKFHQTLPGLIDRRIDARSTFTGMRLARVLIRNPRACYLESGTSGSQQQ
jgi:hypothetical protein